MNRYIVENQRSSNSFCSSKQSPSHTESYQNRFQYVVAGWRGDGRREGQSVDGGKVPIG